MEELKEFLKDLTGRALFTLLKRQREADKKLDLVLEYLKRLEDLENK